MIKYFHPLNKKILIAEPTLHLLFSLTTKELRREGREELKHSPFRVCWPYTLEWLGGLWVSNTADAQRLPLQHTSIDGLCVSIAAPMLAADLGWAAAAASLPQRACPWLRDPANAHECVSSPRRAAMYRGERRGRQKKKNNPPMDFTEVSETKWLWEAS